MGVRFVNKARFFRKLQSTVPAIGNELRLTNAKSAQGMVASAVRLAPRGETGNLQASIRWGKGSGPTAYIVEAGGPLTTKPVRDGASTHYDYALAIEFGAHKRTAQPFFWPAYRLNRKTFKGRISRGIRKALKKAGF